MTRGRLFCPKIKAKLLLWEKRANWRLTAVINEDGWEEVWNIYDEKLEKQLCALGSWLRVLVILDQMLPLMSLIAALILTQLHSCWFESVTPGTGVDLTDVHYYWNIFLLPSVPHGCAASPALDYRFSPHSSFPPGWAPNCCDASDETDLCLLHFVIPCAQSLFDSCQLRLGLMRYCRRFIAPAVPRSDSEWVALGNEGASFTNLWRCAQKEEKTWVYARQLGI